MSAVVSSWRELEGYALDSSLRLERMHSAAPFPVFTGLQSGDGVDTPVMIRFYPDDTETGSIYDRHREAQYLHHLNLLRCFGAGTASLPDGSGAVYGVYERPQAFLADLLEERSFSASEASTLCEDILAGLRFLHENGLVYCNLDRATVAHAGDRWALCDFSQLRPEGTGYAGETRRLMGSIAGAPPEAFNGVVTPAWDAWSLAHLIRSVFQDPKTAKELRNATASSRVPRANIILPEPFGSITSDCLVPDPGSRCSISDIERKLEGARADGGADAAAERAAEPPPVENSAAVEELREPEPALFHTPRDRYEEREESGMLHRISWRALLAGAGVVLLLTVLVTLVRRPQQSASTPKVSPAVQQQVATGPDVDVRPAPIDQNVVPAPAPTDQSSRSRVAEPASGETSVEQIDQVVQQWANAFHHHDMNSEMRYYAPRLDRFFLTRNASSSFVERTKSAALKEAGIIQAYDISNLETHFDSHGIATVTFDKSWDFLGRMHHTGKVRGELKLQRRGSRWLIVSERDLKVYRQSRTRA